MQPIIKSKLWTEVWRRKSLHMLQCQLSKTNFGQKFGEEKVCTCFSALLTHYAIHFLHMPELEIQIIKNLTVAAIIQIHMKWIEQIPCSCWISLALACLPLCSQTRKGTGQCTEISAPY